MTALNRAWAEYIHGVLSNALSVSDAVNRCQATNFWRSPQRRMRPVDGDGNNRAGLPSGCINGICDRRRQGHRQHEPYQDRDGLVGSEPERGMVLNWASLFGCTGRSHFEWNVGVSFAIFICHANGEARALSVSACYCWSEWQDLSLRPPRPDKTGRQTTLENSVLFVTLVAVCLHLVRAKLWPQTDVEG